MPWTGATVLTRTFGAKMVEHMLMEREALESWNETPE
jgi:hypothetical protein